MFHVKHSRSCANALRKEERVESQRKSPTREPTGREHAEDEAGRFIPGTNVSRETLFCAIGRVKASREGRTPRRERENMRHGPTSNTRSTARGRPGAKCAERTRNAATLGRSARTPRDETARGYDGEASKGSARRQKAERMFHVKHSRFHTNAPRKKEHAGSRRKAIGRGCATAEQGKTHRRRNVPAGLRAKRGRTPSASRPSEEESCGELTAGSRGIPQQAAPGGRLSRRAAPRQNRPAGAPPGGLPTGGQALRGPRPPGAWRGPPGGCCTEAPSRGPPGRRPPGRTGSDPWCACPRRPRRR